MPATDISPIHVPYPEATARELRITADACHLHIQPGAGTEWVSGTYQDPSGQRSPTLTMDGGTLTIDHDRTTRDVLGELVAGDPASTCCWERRSRTRSPSRPRRSRATPSWAACPSPGLRSTRRRVRARLGFAQANPQTAEALQLSAEGATVEAGNLPNANAAAISLQGDAASYRLDFGGALQRSTQVAISTRASSVELTVPASTPARIASASLLTDLDVGDGFTRQDGAFWTPAAAAADRPLLTIDASVEVGQLKLRLSQGRS